MKFVGKFVRESFTRDGKREITFTCDTPLLLDETKNYAVDIKEKKPKRSEEQNRLFWELVGQICLKQDGDRRHEKELYIQLLKMSGAKYRTLLCLNEAVSDIENADGIRGVDILKRNGKYSVINVYFGSSKFDTAEMAQLIDTTLNYAYEVGVDDMNYWKGQLK